MLSCGKSLLGKLGLHVRLFYCYHGSIVALFPGLPTIHFLITCSMQKRKGKAWSVLSRKWRQCRQKEEGSPMERTHFVHIFFILNQEWCHFRLVNLRNSIARGKNYKKRLQAPSLDGGPLPPLSTKVDTDIIWVIKWTRPSPSIFVIKNCIVVLLMNF